MASSHYPHPIIAREGWLFIVVAFVAMVLSYFFLHYSITLILAIIFVFVLQFFRDPARLIADAADAIVSPADGRIVVIEKTLDPYRNQEALKISVFMNVFNVHSNRSPTNGTVEEVKYVTGSFLNADLDKASLENERNAVLISTPQGRQITFVQIAGLVARRIKCYIKAGDVLTRGQRYGMIRFGSRVDVYLPLDAVPKVVIGDTVSATETILASLPNQ